MVAHQPRAMYARVAMIGEIAILLNVEAQEPVRMQDAAPTVDGAVTPYLEEHFVDGVLGTTTYRLYVDLSDMVHSVYTIFGREDAPAHFPPAVQQAYPFGVDVGGTNPLFWQAVPDAEYDSWLTVGVDDGSAGAALASIGIGFDGALCSLHAIRTATFLDTLLPHHAARPAC